MIRSLKKKRYLAALGVLVILLITILAPYLLSSSAGLALVLSRINAKVPGTVRVNSWLIGWQQGILCQEVVYQDPGRGINVTIPNLTSTQGLLEVILAPRNLGVIVIENPTVAIDGSWKRAFAAGSDEGGRKDADDVPLWNRITGELQVRDGILQAGQAGQAGQEDSLGLRGIDARTELSGGVVRFETDFHAMQDQGTVKAEGTLNLPARHHAWLDTLITEMRVSLVGLELHDFLHFAAARTAMPAGEGILNADFRVKAVGIRDLQVSGLVEATDLNFTGGFIGQDSPSFQHFRLALDDGRWSTEGWMVQGLELASDTAALSGSGENGPDGFTLAGTGSVDFPVLFDQFPALLKLREATFIESGTMQFDGELRSDAGTMALRLNTSVEGLGGLYAGRDFAWTEPLSLIMNTRVDERDIQVKALQLVAPFGRVEGRGDQNSFVLDAQLDLGRAATEIGRVIDTGWDGSGGLEATVRGSNPNENRTAIEAELAISDFTLNHREMMVVPLHQFSLIGTVEMPRNAIVTRRGAVDLQLALSSWLGDIFLVVNGERPEGKPFRGYFTTDTTVNLDSFSGFLHVLDRLADRINMAGDLQVQAAGYLDEKGIEVREFDSRVGGFVLVNGEQLFVDQQVRLALRQDVNNEVESFIIRKLVVAENRESFFAKGAGLNRFGLEDRNLYLHDIHLTSAQTGSVTLGHFYVDDWRLPLQSMGIDMAADIDLDRFGLLLHNIGLQPGTIQAAGKASLLFAAQTSPGPGPDMDADVRVEQFALLRKGERMLESGNGSVRIKMRGMDTGESEITEFSIASEVLQAEGNGRLKRDGTGGEVTLTGQVTPELGRIATALRTGYGLDLDMKGSAPARFTLALPWPGDMGTWTDRLGLRTTLRADEISSVGIQATAVDIPIALSGRTLQTGIAGSLEDGRVEATVLLDWTAEPAVLSAGESGGMLSGLMLHERAKPLLLAWLHPMFGPLASAAGSADVRLASLSWPLKSEFRQETMAGATIDVSGLLFKGEGVLARVLERFGLPGDLRPREAQIDCTVQAGRITCSPLRLATAERAVVVSGSTGLNGDLDYILDLPITAHLVGDGTYEVLQGERILVPVTGTLDEPLVDERVINDAVTTLDQQAAAQKTTGR